MVNNLHRPDNPKVNLDFVAERVGSGETIFINYKGMIDFGSLSDKKIEIPLLMQVVLNGAEQVVYMDSIIFLNYE